MPPTADEIPALARVVLPDHKRLRSQVLETAARVEIGRSAFLREHGFASELDYKRDAVAAGRIMYHAHIGMSDIDATAAALGNIHRELAAQGYALDRAGFAIDRRMGLPRTRRDGAAAETGPMLETRQDWDALAQTVPVQPHLGDFMIGQPASLENTLEALRIGCTTIGNLSQFFTFEAPGWSDTETTAVRSFEAMSLLAALRERGTLLHSYLEDGYGALFRYCATLAAWAMIERYIVEELIGARLAHCIGGLTRDPIKRAGWVLALHRIHRGEQVGSMIYGDTLSFGQNFERNRAMTAEYLTWDVMLQLHAPSGHALLPLPVTEALRVPSADEIIEAQLFGRRVEESARRLYPHVDFSAAQAFADAICDDGEQIYAAALDGLADAGVDTRDPLQMLYVLKKLGAAAFERLFATGLDTEKSPRSDISDLAEDVVATHRPLFADEALRRRIQGKRFIVASSDVHAHAAGALAQLLDEAGARVVHLGAEQGPAEVVAALERYGADALLLSTHNGMALDYARRLDRLMQQARLDVPVVIGGVLNQKVEAHALPVPVFDELKALGMLPAAALPALKGLLEFKS